MRDIELLGKGAGRGRLARLIQENDDGPVFVYATPSDGDCREIVAAAKAAGRQPPYGAMPCFKFESMGEARRLMAIWLRGGSWDAEPAAPSDSEAAYREFARLARLNEDPLPAGFDELAEMQSEDRL